MHEKPKYPRAVVLLRNRFRAEWTHAAIAKELGVSRQLVGAWCCGICDPAPAEDMRLRQLLKFDSDETPELWGLWGDAHRAAVRAACRPRWTHQKLAEAIDVSRQCVGAYATARATPGARTMAKIQKLFPEVTCPLWFEFD